MILHRIEVPGLAHYSYVVASNGEAAVIDPKRDTDTYLDFAAARGLKITHVLETHIHADYASGAAQLAAEAGADLCVSAHDEQETYQYQMPHHDCRDGDELRVGNLRFVVMHTPGHTPEHISFLLYEGRSAQPLAMFSGDFLFVGSLGRPDLLGEEAKHALASALYESAHRRIADLPDSLEIHPAHGAGSLCGAGMAQRAQSTLGYERYCNRYLGLKDRQAFIETILSTVPPFPDYYRRMKELNGRGAAALREVPGGRGLAPVDFAAAMRRVDTVVVDLRRPEAFGGAHIPGAINIGSGQNLSMWAGWVLPYDRPLLLAGDDGTDLEEARRGFIRVGLDNIAGALAGGMRAWIEAGLDQAHLPQISVRELCGFLPAGAFVLDARTAGEWQAGHIEGARHIPCGELPKRVSEVPRDRRVHIICGSGYRSSIAASILLRHGFTDLVNVDGGMGAWNAQKLPVTQPAAQGCSAG